ncbi:MAG: ammonium transporter, partial [Halobacteriota archaeon]|nr:ammonium transporter [Halobacteriota archaeon]
MKNIKKSTVITVMVMLGMLLCLLPSVLAGDPSGAETLAENPDAPVNYVWVLLCAALVMFMQAGFAMVETGLTRAKNAANILMKNMMDFSAGALVYWAIGFALMFGTTSYG